MTQKFVPTGDTICEKYPEGKIYIAQCGDFSGCDVKFDDLLDYVRRFLCLPVQVLEGVSVERKDNDIILIEDPTQSLSSRNSTRIKRSTLETRY